MKSVSLGFVCQIKIERESGGGHSSFLYHAGKTFVISFSRAAKQKNVDFLIKVPNLIQHVFNSY